MTDGEKGESTKLERKSEARESSFSSFRFSLIVDAEDAAIDPNADAADDDDVLCLRLGLGIISGGGILKGRRRSIGSSSRESLKP